MRDALGSVQSVLLLGGTSEIGLAIVDALVADRARTVVLAARDTAAAERHAATLRDRGATVHVVEFDATRTETHGSVVAEAVGRAGDIDVAIVAFGILGPSEDGGLAAAAELQRVNGAGAVSAMAAVAARMREQGHGTVVLLSSVAADRPRRSNFAYGASKTAADAFARGLADALHGSGAQVLIVRPGFVRGRMTRGRRTAPLAVEPAAVGRAVAEALRRQALTVYVPAGLRWVMLVLRLLPRPLFRRLPM